MQRRALHCPPDRAASWPSSAVASLHHGPLEWPVPRDWQEQIQCRYGDARTTRRRLHSAVPRPPSELVNDRIPGRLGNVGLCACLRRSLLSEPSPVHVPEHVVTAATLQSFKKHLKTFMMQQSYFSGPRSDFGHLGHSNKKLSYRRETARQLHMTTWAGQLTF